MSVGFTITINSNYFSCLTLLPWRVKLSHVFVVSLFKWEESCIM